MVSRPIYISSLSFYLYDDFMMTVNKGQRGIQEKPTIDIDRLFLFFEKRTVMFLKVFTLF